MLYMQELPLTTPTKMYMCVLQHRCVEKYISKMYNKLDYDFTSFVVSQCLGHVSHSKNAEQYICASCDNRLKETINENPVLPYYVKYPNAVAGANFLKALNQRPEYVCSCCHHMLFHKTVQLFHTTDYDMNDEIVKSCLSHWYVMKSHRHTSSENNDIITNTWLQFVADDVEHDDIYVMNEFIYIHCRNSLWHKNQKCLTRHVQMVCSYMIFHRICRTYYHWGEELFLLKYHL